MRWLVLSEQTPAELTVVGLFPNVSEADALDTAAAQHKASDAFYAIDLDATELRRVVGRRTTIEWGAPPEDADAG